MTACDAFSTALKKKSSSLNLYSQVSYALNLHLQRQQQKT
jgi:hypothetical protein